MFLLISVLTCYFFLSNFVAAKKMLVVMVKKTASINDLEVTGCIEDYAQLDLYISNNETLLRKFTETFFQTGESTYFTVC